MFSIIFILILVGLGISLRSHVGTSSFLSRFSTLLERPEIPEGFAYGVAGRTSIAGGFRGRKVVATLHQPGRFARAHLVISIETNATQTVEELELLRFRYARDGQGLDALHGLRLTHQPRCLKALWQPVVVWVPFPGRFRPGKWQRVLESMHTMASMLESPQPRSQP
jgi:hypothetical protein